MTRFEIQVGEPPVTISGREFWPLTPDEAAFVTGYRVVMAQGGGVLHLKVKDGIVTNYEVAPDVGGATLLNALRGVRKLTD